MTSKEIYFCKDDGTRFSTNLIIEIDSNTLYDTSISYLDMSILHGEILGPWRISRKRLACNYLPKRCQPTDKKLKTSSAFNIKTKENILILKSFIDLENLFPVAFVVLKGNKKIVLESIEVEFLPWI